MKDSAHRPLIWIPIRDYRRLQGMVQDRAGRVDRLLRDEMDRAIVCRDSDLPDRVVRVGDRVMFRRDAQLSPEWARLSFEDDAADAADGTVSIASTLGAALLGLREGSRMSYLDQDGTSRLLCVERVIPMDRH
ncbi:regulator of nucleoside diphosphate kinase [Telmatospirillum sp. J64-1]|uniref:regulator of nucleoside diphosphate kinase n=1 Tax=Telmatospirillum sp. J64-1 TaxID=2502183 RepID=UPI00115F0259|nr:regulator of nucleoside diphosphate kinase [Telmatospirillum sp. J64-1]